MNRWIRRKFLFLYKYSGKWISCLLNQKRRKKREACRILLFCNSSTMEEHLLNYVEQVEEDGYQFYIFFGSGYTDGAKHRLEDTLFRGKKIMPLPYLWQMFGRYWDLIVCADLDYPFWLFKGTIPLLYIGHGISNVSYDGGKTVYEYGPESCDEHGEFLFDKVLEPNRRIAALMKESSPKFEDIICHTGYRFAGKIKAESEKGEQYREQFRLPADQPVISFFGSWNRESLFHALGEELFDVCGRLKGQYSFIFSIHPREYQEYDPEIKPMGALVEQQRKKGFLVRSPGEDWIPYIMASDVVVVDYSTMMSLAVLAGKKVIVSEFPDEKIGTCSLGYQVKKTFPVVKNAGELEAALKQVLEGAVFEQMVERFQEELYVSSEEYKKRVRKVTEEMIFGVVFHGDQSPESL